MSSLVKVGSVFIALTISFGSDNNIKVIEQESEPNTVKTFNLNNKIQVIESELAPKEVTPIDVEKINRVRVEKSIRAKKHAKAVQQEQKTNQNKFAGIEQKKEVQQKNMLKKWSSDIDSKFPVVILKDENGQKAIKLPSNHLSK